MTVVNRGEIPGFGGFSYDIAEEPDDAGIYDVHVYPPRFYSAFAILEGDRGDDEKVRLLIDKAANEIVDVILQNPLVAERVERMVADASARGFEDGMTHSCRTPSPRMGW